MDADHLSSIEVLNMSGEGAETAKRWELVAQQRWKVLVDRDVESAERAEVHSLALRGRSSVP